jgi:uncharacterized protein YutE (UPF0331/DUF86 family)
MLIAIQAAIDLGVRICATTSSRRPPSYRETFHILTHKEVIPPTLAGELADLAGFRNTLVHDYGTADTEREYEVLQEDWKFLKEFLGIIKAYIRDKQ